MDGRSPPSEGGLLGDPIGVFDSGVGGLSILRALRQVLPHERFVYLADQAYAPYGGRADAEVRSRSRALTRYLLQSHRIKALVIACNTATAAAVDSLRTQHPALPIIGVEPALKPALAASRSGCIGLMATQGTVQSPRLQALLQRLQAQHPESRIRLQACEGLAEAIEQAAVADPAVDPPELIAKCRDFIGLLSPFSPSSHMAFSAVAAPSAVDTLVLGCTHYPLVAPLLQALAGPGVQLLECGPAVARQTRQRLQALSRLAPPGTGGVRWCSTASGTSLQAAVRRWMGEAAATVHTVPEALLARLQAEAEPR